MGVYIKGMDMPKYCGECNFCYADGFKSWCCPTSREDVLLNAIPEWCPLIKAPEPSIETTKKKAELKENGDWECPDVGCDECDHHRTVEWCSLAIPNHEEIDDTYKMVNEAFFEGFDAAEKRYRLLIETIEELDKKLSASVEVGEWIPIKCHEITESERKENGCPKDWVYYLDCEMPQDGQEILVQAKNGEIRWDVCYEDDGFSLDSGWDWKDDITAWMPLPKPYESQESEGE